MKNSTLIGIVAAAAFVVCGVGWLLLPALQGSQRTVESQASVHVERARRLLHQYDTRLVYKSLLTDQLIEEGIEPDPDDLPDAVADGYQEAHGALWAAYRPVDLPRDWRLDNVRAADARYDSLPGQIREGLDERERLVGENERLLDQALSAIDQALSVTDGDASARSHAEANRLKGVILYQMGFEKRLRAQLLRREADRYRRELVDAAIAVGESKSAQALIAAASFDEQINPLVARAAELDTITRKDRAALAALDTEIRNLEARLTAAQSRRAKASEAMQRLRTEGLDFSDPDGAENFRKRLTEQDRIFREADREVHALEFGTYPRAKIDQSGDYLTGRYVENGAPAGPAIAHGLAHFRDERAVLTAKIEGQQRAAADLSSSVARFQNIKNSMQALSDRTTKRITESATAASDAYAELNRIESEAFTIEETALDLLDRSARASAQAAGYADQWLTDARDRTQGLSPEARDRSPFGPRLDDGWMGGFVAAHEADARLAKAWIYCERYRACTQNAQVLAAVAESLELGEADVDSERTKARQAHDAGVEDIRRAMSVLESAHRKTGRPWTITAQAAGTTYLLVLLGHEDYVEDTIEAYSSAIENRENEDFARTFVARLNRLEE